MIGIVGDGTAAVADLVEDAGGTAVTGTPAEIVGEEPDAVLALGEDVLYELVRAGVDAPVLPVNAGRGVESTRRSELADAIDQVTAGEYGTYSRPLLRATVGEREFHGLADAMLVTSEAARISEYGIRAADEDGDLTPVDAVRADGVVVSTPTGSVGYGSEADGPIVAPTVDAVSVVPVAPFRVEQSHWVVDLPARLTVEREEATVELLVDDQTACHVPAGEPVDLAWHGSITFVASPTAQQFFEGAERLEKT